VKVCTACGTEYSDDVLFCQRDGTPLRASDPTADLVGQVIAERYHIKKKLGEGGMGQVYLAEHVKMGRRCAVKIMSAALLNDPEAVSRFNREAANASRISHANVCAIYDFGETSDGLIYLAMEFVEGRSLTELLKEAGPLPLPRAGGILTQAADALQAAHELGIVHRDLKPDNIMVTTARGRDVVKVVDFGIAKATGADSRSQNVTRTGLVVGTPEYMSPEQLTGDPLDARSDIYSLGLVFYRILTGVLPFKSESAQETMIKRLTDDPLPLAEALPGGRFPPRLQQIMNRALARSAADRYATAAEFGRNVAAVAAAASGPVDTEGATQTLARLSGPTEAVPATRVDSAAQAARRAQREEPPTPTAQRAVRAPPPRPRSMLMPLAGALVILLAVALWRSEAALGPSRAGRCRETGGMPRPIALRRCPTPCRRAPTRPRRRWEHLLAAIRPPCLPWRVTAVAPPGCRRRSRMRRPRIPPPALLRRSTGLSHPRFHHLRPRRSSRHRRRWMILRSGDQPG